MADERTDEVYEEDIPPEGDSEPAFEGAGGRDGGNYEEPAPERVRAG